MSEREREREGGRGRGKGGWSEGRRGVKKERERRITHPMLILLNVYLVSSHRCPGSAWWPILPPPPKECGF